MILAPAGTTIVEALAGAGLKPKSFQEEREIRLRCPKCDGGREREESISLQIDKGGQGAVWICHRGTCGWHDNVVIARDKVLQFSRRSRPVRKPLPVPDSEQNHGDRLYEWFAERGIPRGTVDNFGCYLTKRWFSAKGEHPEGIYPALVFPYRFNGEVVNRKYRSPHKHLGQEKDPLHTLFNIDAVRDNDHIVWCEGETDCMAIDEAGWPQVVSLKDGAPAKARDENDPKRDHDRRYEALGTHADKLAKIEKFYLAGDMDEPGKILREELARRLGRNRCWIVDWPDGCKDAGDVLKTHGPDVVSECIFKARPYPIDGVQEITGRALAEHLNREPPRIMSTGLAALDYAGIRFPGEGRLIVITGVPNSGKSRFVISVMMHLMRCEDRRFLVFSPEMQPWEEFCVLCAQVLLGKPARRTKKWMDSDPLMSFDERIAAGDWLTDRMRFLASDAEDAPPSLEWILERGDAAALRLGITDLLIDPWNEIEHQRGGLSETDYTGRALQKAKAFAYRHGCNVWIVVHPTKMRPATPGDPVHPPGPYDINGSANFANKADIGLTIHTPGDVTRVILWKSRFTRWGRKNAAADLGYDDLSGRYFSPSSAIEAAAVDGEPTRDAWEDDQ